MARDAHAVHFGAVAARLDVDVATGLDGRKARARLRRFGRNVLVRHRRKSLWAILVGQVRSVAVILLAGAAGLSLGFGDVAEGVAILVVLAINAAIGVYTEWRAVRSMEALHRLSRGTARVRRDGRAAVVDARNIVPGDVVLLQSGDVVPADLRVAASTALECDESTLTGESVPVLKTDDPLKRETILADRANMAFRGTAVTRGAGEGIAVATGMATQIGRIAALAQSAEAETSPLERRLDRLTTILVWITLAIAAGIAAAGILRGADLFTMAETAIALAVAAVPEGLPVVATLTLARGMWRMARRNALIERLSAVETLGSTTVILTDKTGTLTQNRMSVARFLLWGSDVDVSPGAGDRSTIFAIDGRPIDPTAVSNLRRALEICALCTETPAGSTPGDQAAPSDPMEAALVAVGAAAGFDTTWPTQARPTLRAHPFDPDSKMMATVHRDDAGLFAAIKGAPEPVIERCHNVLTPDGIRRLTPDERAEWLMRVDNVATGGFRVLALAQKSFADVDADPYSNMTLVGMVCLIDPVREGVPDAVRQCRDAGVRVVMLTGDHAATAIAIARQAGLAAAGDAQPIEGAALDRLDLETLGEREQERIVATDVFARVSPETKLRLVTLYQRRGDIVAMTGDGVNDAPALRKADIGIAMGERGTEVAREAAAMVLKDDSFATIVAAMREGRVIFANIRLFVIYLLSCNVSEILVVGLATVAGLPLPLLPLQVLYLNLVTDVFPAFAVAMGEGDRDVMRAPPRDPGGPVIECRQWVDIAVFGALITAATLGAFMLAQTVLDLAPGAAVTVTFMTIALAQLWNVFNMRGDGERVLSNSISRNPFVWAALGLCLSLVAGAVYLPGPAGIFGLEGLVGEASLGLAIGASLVPLLLGQLWISLAPRRPAFATTRRRAT